MQVDTQLVDKIAKLAKLKFDNEAKENIVRDLGDILKFVDKLSEVNTEGVEPQIYMIDETNILRRDAVVEEITHEEALSNAPLRDSDYIKVPKVINRADE